MSGAANTEDVASRLSGDVTLAILAGGAARRLGGRDKGLEAVGGKPLVAHVATALRGQAGAMLIVANRNAGEYGRHGTVIGDREPGYRGPLAAVAAALDAARTSWLLTVPVDCPDPPPSLVRRLCAAAGASAGAAFVAHDGQRRQPLFALYRRALAASAAAGAAAGAGVAAWQESIAVVEVDFSDQRPHFHNLNTVADFRAYEAE
jgi:molybdopterin-guanine dinucleotide biosynthesis protein A